MKARLRVIAIMAALAIVFLPPLAGTTLLVLQVLGNDSYDLSRYSLSDVPRAAFALILAGSAVGYIYGLLPGLFAALGIGWLVLKGHALSLGRVFVCLGVGGLVGLLVLSPVAGGKQGLALLIVMLGVASALWMIFRRSLLRLHDGAS